ncbi:hypothetical protein J23TS9_55860 [Paenibacillus sp. J23TS9]|uniref:hypothetical protein n=1 Tax=Paenibacillus sp. J23TS9 TaxID=2807193 RepID=UPI001B2ECA0B|nr:hypothetical protein [Paenibacillus sp. J23TS9]GIP30456.1 hypothetical protein J23TS9_55860 [Paenibacillus sp. J23TS9]
MKVLLRIVITLLILVVIGCGIVIWYISPDQKLDLNYQSIDIKAKAVQMLKTRKPEITLSGSELNELAKKELLKHMGDIPQQITVTGAEFHFVGQEVTADINGKWGGLVPFGAELKFHMEASGSVLELNHESTRIKSIHIPAERLGLETITVPLKDHLPDMLTVDHMEFLQDGVKLTFKLDWLSLPSLLLK